MSYIVLSVIAIIIITLKESRLLAQYTYENRNFSYRQNPWIYYTKMFLIFAFNFSKFLWQL
jgi:hypothetical protein